MKSQGHPTCFSGPIFHWPDTMHDAPTDHFGFPRFRILVVDDHQDSAETLALSLKGFGAQVRVALDGMEAIRVALEFLPQVVILDLVMPGMDGYRIAQAMRAQRSLSTIRLLALTGWNVSDAHRRAREAGFDEFLKKPLDLDELKGFLSRFLR